ncbi:hypothetical protein AGMMS49992_24470 [Clostridia bacterium]|nr:hypothetical protein AGMMS49992_24470 [Clostridia bacterium]
MKSFDNYAIGDVNLDGFQVVRGNYFNRQIEPYMSFKETGISFNVSAYKALNCVSTVQIMVNQVNRKILVRPISSDDTDSIAWLKNPDNPDSRPIECSAFTRPLYEMWKWKQKTRYRAYGKLVQSDKKLMLLFDFSSPEIIPPGRQNPVSGGI